MKLIPELGPLAPLVGIWEGDKGDDIAIDDDLKVENNKYRERIKFEYTGVVNNHDQCLHGLRYSTTAWRVGEPDPFHEELGYWLWDARDKQVMRCFMVPRGVTLIAGGPCEPDANVLIMSATIGSNHYGILSNRFLDKKFQTVKFDLKLTIHDEKSLTYEEDTQIKIAGVKEIFHHTDKNSLKKING
jgi:hypothetical protein